MNYGTDFACYLYGGGLEYAELFTARHGDCLLWDAARLFLWENSSLRVLRVADHSIWTATQSVEMKILVGLLFIL